MSESVSRNSHSSVPSSINSSVPLLSSSKSNIYNKKRPLKSNSQNLSFKGFFYKDILNAEKAVRVFNRAEVLEMAEKHLGSNVSRLFDHLIPLDKTVIEESSSGAKYASKLVRLHEDGTVTFSKKTIPHLILAGIAYPFKILPADILNGVVGKLAKKGPLKEWAGKIYESQTFKNIRLRSKIDSQVNSLRGIFETADSLKGADEDKISSKFFQSSIKMFDQKSGNYDTKHERSLNRIVSGFIPAAFLANDAYNLSRMCNDDPKEATAEKKTRFKQETSRVLAQAYLTLITMGAIQKHINNSKFAIMANVGLTALFTETVSRLIAGKQITKLTPEKAREINAKQGGKTPEQNNEANAEDKYKSVFFKATDKKGSKAFFKGVSGSLSPEVISSIQKGVPLKGKTDSKPNTEKQKAPLLSFNTLFKVLAGTIVAGFAIKGLRQNKVVDSLIKKSLEPFNKLYNKLTSEADHAISKEKFNEVVSKLREHGFNELADKYVAVATKNEPIAMGKSIEKILTIKADKVNADIKALDELAGNSKMDALTAILKDSDVAIKEMSQVSEYLKAQGLENVASKYDKTINSLREYSNSPLGKEIKADIARAKAKASEQKVTEKGLEAKDSVELNKILQSIVKDHKENIHVGKKEYKYAKPAVDFVVGPFKFVWNILEGPYYWTNRIIQGLTKQAPKAPEKVTEDITVLGKSFEFIEKAANKKKFNEQVFKDYINDNVAKSFNVDTMSGVSNSDLANLSKTAVLSATLPFLMLDNYNMVMLKSNGKDKEGAELKSKERMVQEGSRFFYQTLLISLFNNTFRTSYNNSLFGMSWVTAACTGIGEWLTRKSVGVPVGQHSRAEIEAMDKKRENANKVAKGYYNFMSRLTGKKSLSEMHKASQEKKPVKA